MRSACPALVRNAFRSARKSSNVCADDTSHPLHLGYPRPSKCVLHFGHSGQALNFPEASIRHRAAPKTNSGPLADPGSSESLSDLSRASASSLAIRFCADSCRALSSSVAARASSARKSSMRYWNSETFSAETLAPRSESTNSINHAKSYTAFSWLGTAGAGYVSGKGAGRHFDGKRT
jgi:hypothetical protein